MVYDKGIGFSIPLFYFGDDYMNTRNKNKLRALLLVLSSHRYVVDVIDFEHDTIVVKIKKI